MLKKTLGFILKTFLLIIMLLTPTIIILIYYVIRFEIPTVVSVIFLYFMPVIFIVFIVFIVQLIWKRPYSLFALPIGFLIAPQFTSVLLPLLGKSFGGGFGGKSLEIALLLFVYAFPFTAIALTIAGIMTFIYFISFNGKKNNNDP